MFVLDKIKLRALRRADLAFFSRADVSLYLDHITESLIFQLELELAGKNGMVSYPSDWWEAFKKRFFPKWLLKKYPVVYHEEKTVYVCPHIDVPKNHSEHLEFITCGIGAGVR
jgi:hypothetical protein